MFRRFLALLATIGALSIPLAAQAASAYSSPTATFTDLQNYGTLSAYIAHATVSDNAAGLHDYDWVPGGCSPDGLLTIAAAGVSTVGTDPGAGCWKAHYSFTGATLRTNQASVDRLGLWISAKANGDSTTQGVGGATSWPAYLAIFTGRTVINAGAGGQTNPQIAMRQGGYNALPTVTVPSNTVPASGAVFINFLYSYEPLTNQGPTTLPVAIGGVPGTLTWVGANFTASVGPGSTVMHVTARSGTGLLAPGQEIFQGGAAPGTFIVSQTSGSTGDVGDYVVNISQTIASQPLYSSSWSFARTTSGSSVSVSNPTPLVVNVGTSNQDAVVLWGGRNGFNDPTSVANADAAMIAALGTNTHWILPSILNGDGECIGTSAYNAIKVVNDKKATYIGHFIDIRGYGANRVNLTDGTYSTQALIDAGITPTSGDLTDIDCGTVPRSLRQDALHPTNQFNELIASKFGLALSGTMLVGYGTSHPAAPIDVVGPSGRIQLQSNGGISGGQIGGALTVAAGPWSNGNVVINASPAALLYLNLNTGAGTIFGNGAGAAVGALNSAGQFSLGTTTPAKKLTVLTSTFGDGIQVFSNGANGQTIVVNDSINGPTIGMRLAGGGSVLGQMGGVITSGTGSLTHFFVGTDAMGSLTNAQLDFTPANVNAMVNDALTSAFNTPLSITHGTSGTAAAGLGAWLNWSLENAAGSNVTFGQVGVGETVATGGSEDGNFIVQTMNAGTLANALNFTRGKYVFGAAGPYSNIFGVGGNNSPYIFEPYVIDSTPRATSNRVVGYGASPGFISARSEGSPSAPATVNAGTNLLALTGSGYNGSTFSTQAQILFTASQTWVSTTAKGADITFQGTAPSTGSLQNIATLKGSGHFQVVNSVAPAVSSCGTSPAVGANASDAQGYVTEGTVATGCTVTFANAYNAKPACTVTDEAGLQFSYAVSATTLVITNIGALSGTSFHYQCEGG